MKFWLLLTIINLHNIIEFKVFCEKIVENAGKLLISYKNKSKIVKQKDIQDIATNADLASEKYLIDAILKKFPDHGIISEEQGEINPKAEFKWIIDPLDGTKEFIRGIPQWNVSIALLHKDKTIVSAIYRPYENLLYSSAIGIGSFKNGKKIKVSEIKKLEEGFIYCYIPSYKRNQEKYDWAFNKLKEIGKHAYRLRALADENTALCWLAQGGCEAYINLSNPPKDHDILPGLLVAKEAEAYNAINNIPLVVANNKNIYNELAKIIYDK